MQADDKRREHSKPNWSAVECLRPKTAHKEKALKNVYHTVGKNTLQVNWPGEAVA